MPYGVRQDGGGQRARQHGGAQARAGHHGGGVAREVGGLVAGVVADDDEPAVLPLGLQVRGEARRGPDHHGAVHPHRPGPQLAAQPGGAELERAREADGQLLGGARLDQRGQLVARLGVGVLGQPGSGLCDEVVLHGGRLSGVCGAVVGRCGWADAGAPPRTPLLERRRGWMGARSSTREGRKRPGPSAGGGGSGPLPPEGLRTRCAPAPSPAVRPSGSRSRGPPGGPPRG